MTAKDQDSSAYAVLIQVRDLDNMKHFYRDTLGLGDPLVDSNIWVEFQLPGNALVALEQSNTVSPEKRSNGVSWMLNVSDFTAATTRLREKGVTIVRPAAQVPGKKCMTFADPEGNAFTVCAGTGAAG